MSQYFQLKFIIFPMSFYCVMNRNRMFDSHAINSRILYRTDINQFFTTETPTVIKQQVPFTTLAMSTFCRHFATSVERVDGDWRGEAVSHPSQRVTWRRHVAHSIHNYFILCVHGRETIGVIFFHLAASAGAWKSIFLDKWKLRSLCFCGAAAVSFIYIRLYLWLTVFKWMSAFRIDFFLQVHRELFQYRVLT